jgi:hypothetical protein
MVVPASHLAYVRALLLRGRTYTWAGMHPIRGEGSTSLQSLSLNERGMSFMTHVRRTHQQVEDALFWCNNAGLAQNKRILGRVQ